jgi:uncharacterized protein YggE
MAVLLFTASTAFAEGPPAMGRNLILTEGVAELMGQNDSAKLSIAVVTEGPNLEEVSSENASKTKEVLKAIKDLDVENLKLKTSGYRVTPRRDYKARPPKIKGYEVYNAIESVLEGFEPEPLSRNVSRIIEKALGSGANNINHVEFYIKSRRPLEKKALTEATQEAMDRAKTLAEAAGVKLKRIATLSTQPIHSPPQPHMLRAAEMNDGSLGMAPPIEVGESKIHVQVNIAYEIE